MKKFLLMIIGLLLLLPIGVLAAEAPSVDTVTATISGDKITYSGTTVNDCVAVMCKLYNSNGDEITKYSSAVDEDKFNGEFTVTANGEYEVRCANYEGGEIKSAKVTASEVKNPETGDKIYTYGIIGGIALVGLGVVVVILTKKKK